MVYNTALLSAQNKKSFEKIYTTPSEWGRWVESAVGAHLINCAEENDLNIHYWRNRDNEVDFIIQAGDNLIGIEVKSGKRGKNSGMFEFSKQFHPKSMIVVGTGGMPLEEFLKIDPSDLID